MMANPMPEELRVGLLEQGYKHIDVGDVVLDLGSGQITRTISLDGVEKARAVFPSVEVDWAIVAAAVLANRCA